MADDKTKPSLHQPKAPEPKAAETTDFDYRAAYEKQAGELAELRTLLMATIQSQPKASPDSLWAKNHEKEMAIKAELDKLAARFQTSCKDRTQWDANKLNPEGKRLFKVQVGWCPEIVVRANDDIMAKAYYDSVCGIRGVTTNHGKPETTTYSIVDVTDDPAAQKLARSEWDYQAAAA